MLCACYVVFQLRWPLDVVRGDGSEEVTARNFERKCRWGLGEEEASV
jgi:hypothetical protein